MKRIIAILSIAFFLAFIASCDHYDNFREPNSNSPQDLAYAKTLDSIDSLITGFYYYDFNDSIILPAFGFYKKNNSRRNFWMQARCHYLIGALQFGENHVSEMAAKHLVEALKILDDYDDYISSKIAFNFSDGRSCKRFAMLGLDNAVMANDTAWMARSCSNLGIKSCIEDWILCDQEGICRFLKLKGVPKTLKGDNGIEKLDDLFGKANKVYQKGYQIKDVVATLDMGVIRKKNKDILKPLEKVLNVTVS
ncbi:MAG: hypothetical protein J6W12_06490 [Bacteroidales bacterium]|nr:hypothetical protein [Bacteroidales bacterium]